jgi:hypothetical protein
MKNLRKFFNNFNEHLTVPAIIVLAVLVILVTSLFGCQKETSFTKEPPRVQSKCDLRPKEGFSYAKRAYVPGEAARKGGTKGPKGKPQPPTDTTGGGTDNPPPPTGGPVILLDFDGHTVEGTYWNVNGPIYARYSGMNATEIQTTVDSVQADYREFNVTVTTDEGVYYAAPVNKRVRVIITELYEWYGMAGGVAYVNSFTWGNETPAFVFSSLLGYSAKNVWEAAAHEAGHTLGLRHQADWVDGVKISDYREGVIMGVGYYRPNVYWTVGLNSYGQLQDDKAIIRSTLSR